MSADLKDLALDLTWSWEPRITRLFEVLDPELWRETGQNPIALLNRLGDEGMAAAVERPEVAAALDAARTAIREHRDRMPPFLDARAPLVVGYFSLEFGLVECLPIYAGGLGILAGDHLKASSDLGLPLVGVGLLYRNGFGRQRIDEERWAGCRSSCSTPISTTTRPTSGPSATASTRRSPTAACAKRSCSASAECARCGPWASKPPSST
ncbi:MAG: glycosyltransferase family 1 protein [Chloroflexi bacterium]|nr:MAG: glycosyltransferase family 1 protein [Chloroflexota bacterium]